MKYAILTEKYKPKSIKEVIGCPQVLLKTLDSPEKLDHILLHSRKAGTGKTSIMNAVVKDFDGEALFMNASDERKIDDVREKIKRFCQTESINGKQKFVCLDEIDGMGKIAQDALKSIMEKYKPIFILTANNVDKIIEPLQSRCKGFMFNLQSPPKDKCIERLRMIIEKEKIIISVPAIEKIVGVNYPSMRDMIKQLQRLSLEKESIEIADVKLPTDIYKELYNKIKTGNLQEVRKEWIERGYVLRDVLKEFFELVLVDTFTKKANIIQTIAETEYKMAVGCDEDIALFYGVIKMKALMKE